MNRTHSRIRRCDVHPIILEAGENAVDWYLNFFLVRKRNRHTQRSYWRHLQTFFLWCSQHHLALSEIHSKHVAWYVEHEEGRDLAPQSIKQMLGALRSCFQFLVIREVLSENPAVGVDGPSYSTTKGKTPYLDDGQVQRLFATADPRTLVGLRDRALMGIMFYAMARVGAAVGLKVGKYSKNGRWWQLQLHEKNGKDHAVPVHPTLKRWLDEYLGRVPFRDSLDHPLFMSMDKYRKRFTENVLSTGDVWSMIKRRSKRAGLPGSTTCHSLRASGITSFRKAGGSLAQARILAGHSSEKTTEMYDHSEDEITMRDLRRMPG